MILVLFIFFLALIIISLSVISLIIGLVLLMVSHTKQKKDEVNAKRIKNIGIALTAVGAAILLNIAVLAIYIYSNF